MQAWIANFHRFVEGDLHLIDDCCLLTVSRHQAVPPVDESHHWGSEMSRMLPLPDAFVVSLSIFLQPVLNTGSMRVYFRSQSVARSPPKSFLLNMWLCIYRSFGKVHLQASHTVYYSSMRCWIFLPQIGTLQKFIFGLPSQDAPLYLVLR